MKAHRTSTDQATRIGRNIRFFRELLGMSQEKLSQLSDSERSYVGKIERGKNSPTVDKVFDIAKALGIPPCMLFYAESDSGDESASPADPSGALKEFMEGRLANAHGEPTEGDMTFMVTVRGDRAYWQPVTATNATKIMAAALKALEGDDGDDASQDAITRTDITGTVLKGSHRTDGSKASGEAYA